jgi:hypothetical protein
LGSYRFLQFQWTCEMTKMPMIGWSRPVRDFRKKKTLPIWFGRTGRPSHSTLSSSLGALPHAHAREAVGSPTPLWWKQLRVYQLVGNPSAECCSKRLFTTRVTRDFILNSRGIGPELPFASPLQATYKSK